ncbi:retention module-containing protein, partial [Aeromonas diversa]|uniref:retention module-containing protein n=1 Tax=Aeromonas diversa TaxID=502790 RepID=UPI0039A3782D
MSTTTLQHDAVISQLSGKVYLVNEDGTRRLVLEGELLPKGAVVVSDDGAFELRDPAPLAQGDEPAEQVTASVSGDIDALQQAILEGQDPTQAFDATAAGGAPAAGGGVAGTSNSGFVVLERSGYETLAVAGYDTTRTETVALSENVTPGIDDFKPDAELTLSADGSVSEGGSITYVATVDHPVYGSELVVTLSNGATIVIPLGQTTASVVVAAPGDDVYQDASTLSVSVTGTSGGNFNTVTAGPAVTTEVTDTIDTATATLTATPSVTEGGVITYTVTLSHPAQGEVSLTLSNGQIVTIAYGQRIGSIDFQTPPNDVYNNGSTVSATITAASGGNFEQLAVSQAPAETRINDSIDVTTVTLSSATQGQNVVEGGSIVYTATASNPVTETPLLVTLSNGVVITIPVGASSASSEPISVRGDDIYQQGNEVLSVTITGTNGGNYEALTPSGTVTHIVVDDQDAPTLTLTGDASVLEGSRANYTLTISDAPKSDLIVKMVVGHITTDDGDVQTVTRDVVIKAGTTATTFEVASQDDAIDEPVEQFLVSVTDVSGGGYEKAPALPNSVVTSVIDNDEAPDVDRVSDALDVRGEVVDEGESAVFTVTLTNGSSSETAFNWSLGDKSATLGLDYTRDVTLSDGVTLSADGSQLIVPAGVTHFTVTVPTLEDSVDEQDETFTLTVGGKSGTATIIDNDAGPTIDSVSVTNADAKAEEGTDLHFQVTLSAASEQVTHHGFNLAGVTAGEGDFDRAGVTFSNGVTLSGDGQSVIVPAGVSGFTVTVPTVNDSLDEADETLTLTVGGKDATGIIVDNDNAPDVDRVSDALDVRGEVVDEGE